MKVSHKTIAAVSTAIIIITMLTIAALYAETYTALQTVSPVAVIAAAAVVVIGVVWFKKSSK